LMTRYDRRRRLPTIAEADPPSAASGPSSLPLWREPAPRTSRSERTGR
jgi:hypothetical protein